ncbi:DUF3995 domain-containing protein [Snuella lapsa]|uniref:DUF3995 domain-containing protein n=1 Tax=Snuella lapsa TaxID=870481 RepID=A0ABP6YCX2_9FLAO
MTIKILSVVLFLIFTALSGFHFYWFFGGKRGLEMVIPSKDNTSRIPSVPKLATLTVGIILVLFGALYLIKSGAITIQLSNWMVNYTYWFIPSIFILRAIGDFKYLGLLKKIKNTKFGKADSRIFSPLCLIIGFIGMLIQLAN